MARIPIVGIACDRHFSDNHYYQRAGEKYLAAIRDGAGAHPVLIPSVTPALEPDPIVNMLDGLLFPGSPSNVAPRHYGGHEAREPWRIDPARDATTLPLLRTAVAAGLPCLCICRGFQELNVALGGTLHQHLEEVDGFFDHRERNEDPIEFQYGAAHRIRIVPEGILARITGCRAEVEVNSLHGQGIDQLAPGLMVEACAPDGAIEAATLEKPQGFVLGVQFHPEWEFADNPFYSAIFRGFGEAMRAPARRNTSNNC